MTSTDATQSLAEGDELKTEWLPIATAPRDGRVIIVMDEDCGEFPAAWNPTATNALFAPGKMGMWEAPDRSYTWQDHPEYGPTFWRPLTGASQ